MLKISWSGNSKYFIHCQWLAHWKYTINMSYQTGISLTYSKVGWEVACDTLLLWALYFKHTVLQEKITTMAYTERGIFSLLLWLSMRYNHTSKACSCNATAAMWIHHSKYLFTGLFIQYSLSYIHQHTLIVHTL